MKRRRLCITADVLLKEVNGFKSHFRTPQNEWVLSSPPIPNWLSATDLRQVNAIFFVRTNILDEKINPPNALAVLAGISQLVSFNAPHHSFYLVTRAMKSIGVELVHCRFNAQWPTAMNYCGSHKVATLHSGDQLVVSGAFSTHHQVECHAWLVPELITSSVRLH